jgi:hypothetical protein
MLRRFIVVNDPVNIRRMSRGFELEAVQPEKQIFT